MEKVRIGIIGLGKMGAHHAKYIYDNEVQGAKLTAVCDISFERLIWAKENFIGINVFNNVDDMFDSNTVDAVIVATIHFTHPEIAIKAFRKDLHVMIEKPSGVYCKQVSEMNKVAAESGKVFGIMYNQRTNPVYAKLKELIDSSELGEIKRTNWIITNWYRSQSYYDSGKWRATWAGEGGGVLLNQDPHQLDLWQWMCGMPKKVRAFCYYGKYHDIEVEDDVTAFVEYENGATGVFVTSTADAPGTNRLEISSDNGKVVVEDDTLTFWKLRVPERKFNAEFRGSSGAPEHRKFDIPVKGEFTGHKGITSNWVEAILYDRPLIAPGHEGIRGLSISNAMHLSSWINDWVELPADEDLFYNELSRRIKTSVYEPE